MDRPLIDRAMDLIEELLKDQELLKVPIRNQALCEEGERLIAEYIAGPPPTEGRVHAARELNRGVERG